MFIDRSRSIGYCVSGQKIQELYNLLVNKEYKLHHNVILMIGTNDLKNVSLKTANIHGIALIIFAFRTQH